MPQRLHGVRATRTCSSTLVHTATGMRRVFFSSLAWRVLVSQTSQYRACHMIVVSGSTGQPRHSLASSGAVSWIRDIQYYENITNHHQQPPSTNNLSPVTIGEPAQPSYLLTLGQSPSHRLLSSVIGQPYYETTPGTANLPSLLPAFQELPLHPGCNLAFAAWLDCYAEVCFISGTGGS